MEKINVIDLDKTLVPFDTFRLFILEEIMDRLNIRIFLITALRRLKMISTSSFKARVIEEISGKKNPILELNFGYKMYDLIDEKILKIIDQETDAETINVLVSASPNFYVQKIIDLLGWQGSGSYFDESKCFVHLYGSNKISWVLKHFDPDKYVYNFAVSDSDSDKELLRMFQKSLIWKQTKHIKKPSKKNE